MRDVSEHLVKLLLVVFELELVHLDFVLELTDFVQILVILLPLPGERG